MISEILENLDVYIDVISMTPLSYIVIIKLVFKID